MEWYKRQLYYITRFQTSMHYNGQMQDICLRQEDCQPIDDVEDTVLTVISYIGIALSIIGLILTIVTVLIFK